METFPSHNIPHKSTAVLLHLYAIVTQSVIPLQFQRNGRTRPPGYIELGPVGRQSRSPIAPGLLQDEALHHLTNPHAILNPFTIPSQFVNVTAGVYRTRAGPWAVSFTDCTRIAAGSRIAPASHQSVGSQLPISDLQPGPIHIAFPTKAFQILHPSHSVTETQSYQSSRNPPSLCNSNAIRERDCRGI